VIFFDIGTWRFIDTPMFVRGLNFLLCVFSTVVINSSVAELENRMNILTQEYFIGFGFSKVLIVEGSGGGALCSQKGHLGLKTLLCCPPQKMGGQRDK